MRTESVILLVVSLLLAMGSINCGDRYEIQQVAQELIRFFG